MFSKFAALLLIAFTGSAVAQFCNTGPVQCCNSLHQVGDYDATKIASLVGVAATSIKGQVGLQCNPITVIGSGKGAKCASAPVCCEKNYANQLVGVNCSPVAL